MRKSPFSTGLLVGLAAVFLLSTQAAFADPNLVSWWKFDEGIGSTAYDSAGTNNGSITGASWFNDPYRGMCLSFDGSYDYVFLSNFTVSTNNGTIALWLKTSADFSANYGSQGNLISQNDMYCGYLAVAGNGTEPYWIIGETNIQDDYFVGVGGAVLVGVWNHIAVSFYNKTAKTYLNGELIDTRSITNSSLTLDRIGGIIKEFFNGKIDDVRIYTRALSAGDVWQIYEEGFGGRAFNPNPTNGAASVDPNIVLSWSRGKDAASHDVYFGADYNDVNNADTSSLDYKGNFDINSFDPGGLDIFRTYYWRIDEVNEPNLQKGNVWSFKTGGPEIELSETQFLSTALLGGANPNVQILGISNSGQSTLNWHINEDCDWLSVEPNSGSSTGEVDDVSLNVDISGLPVGKYTCSLTISDVNASNSPQTVAVTLYVIIPEDALYVPLEYPTIQAAINASIDGNTIIVAPGTYTGEGNRDIDFIGKAITVRNIAPTDPCIVAQTILDCSSTGRAFNFTSGEDTNSVLAGFTIIASNVADGISSSGSSPTITNCTISKGMYGIYCSDSNATITGCTISNNSGSGIGCYNSNPVITGCTIIRNASNNGGGIYCSSSNPTITNCTITGNSDNSNGGGIYCEDSNAIIAGCIITGNSAYVDGGGIYCSGGNSVITNCTITGNSAILGSGIIYYYGSNSTLTNCTISDNSGGGIYCEDSNLTITSCIIKDNFFTGIYGFLNDNSLMVANCIISNNGATGVFCLGGNVTISDCNISSNSGSGISCWINNPVITGCIIRESYYAGIGCLESDAVIADCEISDNSGGGIYCDLSKPEITNCTISGNSTSSSNYNDGGGIYCYYKSGPTLTNCIFSGNVAFKGGGMFICYNSNPTLTNCIFISNKAEYGNAIYCDSENQAFPNILKISNSILWDDGNEVWNNDGSTIIINYSDVQSGYPGLGNIDADPCFVDPGFWDTNDTPEDSNDDFWVDGDYHLKSEGWRWDSTRQRWDWDDVTSRCIDAGNPGSPLRDELLSIPDDPDNEWGQNLRIDMGAFGGTAEASIPPYDWTLLSDVTNDGVSDFSDLDILSSLWLNTGEQLYADFNRDGIVDLFDFALLAQDWLAQTSWH